MIEEKTVYVTRGKQFDSLEKAEAYRVDMVGEFMDRVPAIFSPRDRIKLVDYITTNRDSLRQLLDY